MTTLGRGRQLQLEDNACYFVFLDIDKEQLFPLESSLTAFYGIAADDKKTITLYGHLNFPREQALVCKESIPLKEMLTRIEPEFDYNKFNDDVLVTCNQPIFQKHLVISLLFRIERITAKQQRSD